MPPMTFGSGSRSRGSGCPELRLPRSRAGRWPFQRPAAWFVVTDGHLADLRAGARLNSSKFSSPPPPLRRLRRASRIRWAFAQSDRLPGLTIAPPAPLLKLLVLPGFAPLPCFLRPVHSRWHRLRGAWLRPVAAKPPTRSVPVVSLHLDGFLRDAVPACCSRFRIWGSPRWPRIDRSEPARPGCPCGRPFRMASGRVVRRVSDGAAPYEGFLLAGSRTASLRPVALLPLLRPRSPTSSPVEPTTPDHRLPGGQMDRNDRWTGRAARLRWAVAPLGSAPGFPPRPARSRDRDRETRRPRGRPSSQLESHGAPLGSSPGCPREQRRDATGAELQRDPLPGHATAPRATSAAAHRRADSAQRPATCGTRHEAESSRNPPNPTRGRAGRSADIRTKQDTAGTDARPPGRSQSAMEPPTRPQPLRVP